MAHNILTYVAALPRGHKAVHRLVEVLAYLLCERHLLIARLISGIDKAVGILECFKAVGKYAFPLYKCIFGCGNGDDIVDHIVSAVCRLHHVAVHSSRPNLNRAEIHYRGGKHSLALFAVIFKGGAQQFIAHSIGFHTV